MPEEPGTEAHNTVYEEVTKTIPKKKKYKKAKWLSEVLQTAEKRSERQGKNRKIYPTECRVSKKSRDKKAFFFFLFFIYFY